MVADPSHGHARPDGGEASRSEPGRPETLILGSDWDAQADRLEHPFLTSGWLRAWWDAFAPAGAEVRAVAPGLGGSLAGGPGYRPRAGMDLCALAHAPPPISRHRRQSPARSL